MMSYLVYKNCEDKIQKAEFKFFSYNFYLYSQWSCAAFVTIAICCQQERLLLTGE